MTDSKRLLYICCVVFLPALVLYILLVWLTYKTYWGIEIMTATVLFATLCAIIIYTWKTWQLKDLTSKQITFAIRPFVIFEPHNCVIKNIGNGIALDVKIDKIPLKNCKGSFTKSEIEEKAYIIFTGIGCLAKGESFQGIKLSILANWGDTSPLPTPIHNAIHDINHSMTQFEMCIKYKDIEKMEYRTYMAIKDSTFQVVDIK